MTITPSAAPHPTRRRVVDAPTRMWHTLLACSFLGAYLSADSERWRLLHVTLGYTVAGLLLCRLLYAWWGPRPMRWATWHSQVRSGWAWGQGAWQALRTGAWASVNWRQGQNLALRWVTLAVLLGVVPVTLTGYLTYHEWGATTWGTEVVEALGELHEGLGEALGMAVLAHVVSLLALSVWRRQNLTAPMLTGHAPGPGPHLITHRRVVWAVLLLVAVLAYWGWEWQQSPRGLWPTKNLKKNYDD